MCIVGIKQNPKLEHIGPGGWKYLLVSEKSKYHIFKNVEVHTDYTFVFK